MVNFERKTLLLGLASIGLSNLAFHRESTCWNPGTWVLKIGLITQGPIVGTEYIDT